MSIININAFAAFFQEIPPDLKKTLNINIFTTFLPIYKTFRVKPEMSNVFVLIRQKSKRRFPPTLTPIDKRLILNY